MKLSKGKSAGSSVWARTLSGLALVGLAVAAAVPILMVGQASSTSQNADGSWVSADLGQRFEITADTTELRLACPPGLVNPLELGSLTDEASVWISGGAEEKNLQGMGAIVIPTQLNQSDQFPAAVSVSGASEGDSAGLLVSSCQVPANRLALVGGSTVVGEDTFVAIVNPNPRAVQVNVTAYGASGKLEQLPQPLTVPAEASTVWMPAPWFPDEERLSLVLESDGQGVAAWLQSSGRDGEVPLGVGRLAGTDLATVNVFPGFQELSGPAVLRVLNPTEEVLTVKVSVLDENGEAVVPGAESLVVDPGAVFEVNLDGVGAQPVTLVASADSAFSAAIVAQEIGKEHPLVKNKKIQSRTLMAPARLTEVASFPAAAKLAELVKSRGFTDPQMKLTLANLNPDPLTVTAGETEYVIAPSTSRTFTVEETADLTEATLDAATYATLGVSAGSGFGPVNAVTGLGFGGFAVASRTVVLAP